MKITKIKAVEVWESVFAELYSRCEFEDWWDGIEGVVQQEIVDACIERVRKSI